MNCGSILVRDCPPGFGARCDQKSVNYGGGVAIRGWSACKPTTSAWGDSGFRVCHDLNVGFVGFRF